MSEENVEIVRRMYEAYLAGDYEASLAAYEAEVEFDVSMRPEGRIYRGRDGVIEAVRTWTGTWEDYTAEIEEVIDAGDKVLLVDRQLGRGKSSGAPLDQQTFWVYTLSEGKIVRVKWVPTRAEALTAAGLGGAT
jgi:ketosteroid isomerase-like protein